MIEKKIKIKGVEDAKKLVSLAMKCDFPVEIVSDDITVDAKSIMGIFSLDFGSETTMLFGCDHSCNAVEAFSEYFI